MNYKNVMMVLSTIFVLLASFESLIGSEPVIVCREVLFAILYAIYAQRIPE